LRDPAPKLEKKNGPIQEGSFKETEAQGDLLKAPFFDFLLKFFGNKLGSAQNFQKLPQQIATRQGSTPSESSSSRGFRESPPATVSGGSEGEKCRMERSLD